MSEHARARAVVDQIAAATSLVRVVGMNDALRLAGHGLRMVADLDHWILSYREMDLTKVVGMNAAKRSEIIRKLTAWYSRRFLEALQAIRQHEETR